MYKTRRTVAIAALASLAVVAQPSRAACTFGVSSETSLQGVFDSVLGANALSASNDCVAADADGIWTAQGRAAATIVIELAGFADRNVLGIYDPLHPKSQQVSIFDGAASSGASTTLELIPNGAGYDVRANDVVQGHFGSEAFGFYLRTPQHQTFFSQASLNDDRADHLYAYAGNGAAFVGGPLAGGAFAASMYLLAFEDLPIPRADRDFQDFVATVNFIAPIPLPASAWLLAAALLAFVASRRRPVVIPTSN